MGDSSLVHIDKHELPILENHLSQPAEPTVVDAHLRKKARRKKQKGKFYNMLVGNACDQVWDRDVYKKPLDTKEARGLRRQTLRTMTGSGKVAGGSLAPQCRGHVSA